ncbi:hypothetical protein ENLAB_09050 [Enterococcus innesii]|uniref:Uncharacterized protein n=1 Tax=Enterococcus innesii TaxID=2839759 RepID=A0ABN6NQG5_9ENTE|nr:hypothetical protein ENLAB_09050 [Enterococcus innesii]
MIHKALAPVNQLASASVLAKASGIVRKLHLANQPPLAKALVQVKVSEIPNRLVQVTVQV